MFYTVCLPIVARVVVHLRKNWSNNFFNKLLCVFSRISGSIGNFYNNFLAVSNLPLMTEELRELGCRQQR